MFGSSSPKEGPADNESAVSPIAEGPGLPQSDGPATAKDDTTTIRSSQSPRRTSTSIDGSGEKKRRSSGVGQRASSLLASAKNSLHFSPNPNSRDYGKTDGSGQTPLQKLGKQDPALSVPQGQHNNSAGESHSSPRSTFKVGVWEDKNKKCRRTMEDTHAFLYNFLHTPMPNVSDSALASSAAGVQSQKSTDELVQKDSEFSSSGVSLSQLSSKSTSDVMETDNGYFAIFDGHAGTFAADWCGKKLHIILEEMIRKNPNTAIPELLDQTFTSVDQRLDKLPLKNSGCTAVVAMLRWEDRIPNTQSATGSTAIAPATAAAVRAQQDSSSKKDDAASVAESAINAVNSDKSGPIDATASAQSSIHETHAKLKVSAMRQRVLYTANVGDARIVLCRNGKALRLSYDHKGSDENEGRRIAAAGGLILNNRVNGVLAVTRALGDAYMKDLVTGHPYTTETVIQPDLDEFIILACDGVWDVCTDQDAVDLIRNVAEPVQAAKQLVEHALNRFSTDNLSCMIVRFDRSALVDSSQNPASAIGVEGDHNSSGSKVSEVDKIVSEAKRSIMQGGESVGISGSNSGKGHDPVLTEGMTPTSAVVHNQASPVGVGPSVEQMERVIEEEPSLVEGEDANEMTPSGVHDIDPETRAGLKGIPVMHAGSALLKAPDWNAPASQSPPKDREES